MTNEQNEPTEDSKRLALLERFLADLRFAYNTGAAQPDIIAILASRLRVL